MDYDLLSNIHLKGNEATARPSSIFLLTSLPSCMCISRESQTPRLTIKGIRRSFPVPNVHRQYPFPSHCARITATIKPNALIIDPALRRDDPLFAKAPSVATGAGVKIALLTPVVETVLMDVAAAANVLDAVVVTVLLSVTSPPDVLDAGLVCVPCEFAEFVPANVLPEELDGLAELVVELASPPTMTPLPVVILETEVDVTSVVVVVGEELPDGVDEIPMRVSVRTVVEAGGDISLLGNVDVKICVAVSRVVDVPCRPIGTTAVLVAVFDAVAELAFVVSEDIVTVGTETVATGVTPAAVDM